MGGFYRPPIEGALLPPRSTLSLKPKPGHSIVDWLTNASQTPQFEGEIPSRDALASLTPSAPSKTTAGGAANALMGRTADAVHVAAAGEPPVSSGRDRGEDAAHKELAAAAATAGQRQEANPTTSVKAPAKPAETPQDTLYSRVKMVKMPNGKVVAVDPGTAARYAGEGASYEPVTSRGGEISGPGARFGPGGPVPDPTSDAFWDEVRAGAGQTPLDAPGSGFIDIGGGAKIRRPSGIEQALARREYTDTQQAEERAKLADETAQAVQSAKAEQEIRAAQIDPLEAARIRAMGQYGGEQIKEGALSARVVAAARAAQHYYDLANRVRAEGAGSRDPGFRQQKEAEAKALEEQARAFGSILLGIAPRNPELNPLLAMMGMLGAGGAAPAPTTK